MLDFICNGSVDLFGTGRERKIQNENICLQRDLNPQPASPRQESCSALDRSATLVRYQVEHYSLTVFAPSPFRTGQRSRCKWNQACPFTWSHSCFRPQISCGIHAVYVKHTQLWVRPFWQLGKQKSEGFGFPNKWSALEHLSYVLFNNLKTRRHG